MSKTLRQETQFVQNILRKEKHLGGPKKSRTDLGAQRRFKRALKMRQENIEAARKKKAKTPKSATPRETILGARPRTKVA